MVNLYELFQENKIKVLNPLYSYKKQALQEKSRDYEYYPGKSTMPPILQHCGSKYAFCK